VGGFDTLESPEISGVEFDALGVSASKSLSNPRVVESLAVSKLGVAKGEAEGSAEEKTAEDSEVVGVEVERTSLSSVVRVGEESTGSSESKSGCSSEDGGPVSGVAVHQVEVVGVVLDGINALDLEEHFFVSFLNVSCVGFNVNSVTSHLFLIDSI